jgi:hypothetical protein
MVDEHPLSDDGRGIPCRGLESAARGLPGEGSGTIDLRRANTTAGLDQGQFRASAYSRVARFGSFSAAVIELSFPTTQEIVVQLHQLPRGCEGRGRTGKLKIASAPKGFQVKLEIVRRS